MHFKKSIWLGAALVAAALGTGARAIAQQAFDHPTYKGSNLRQGKNGDPSRNGPGLSFLRWFTPNGVNASFVKPIIDNTDTNPTSAASDGGPYDPNFYGFCQSTTGWFAPVADTLASLAYEIPSRRIATANYPRLLDLRTPSYAYATCVPTRSAPYDDRTPGANTTLKTFTWRFRGEGTPKNYAIWVNIPVGPTKIGNTNFYPQRYFVYEVTYGPNDNQKYVDRVDTYASGGGWVRLGGGGLPNTRVFPFDGTNRISVRLYNTVPRDSEGKLTMAGTTTGPLNGMDKYLVYADAVRFEPAMGNYAASPSSMRLGTDPNTTVVTDVNNQLSVGRQLDALTTIGNALVTTRAYNYVNGAVNNWTYSTLGESGYPLEIDDSQDVNRTFDLTVPEHIGGTNASMAQISNDPAQVKTVTYTPSTTLNDETYEIWAYLPGTRPSPTTRYAKNTVYTITELGSTYSFRVDQEAGRGWVRIGGRRFRNLPAIGTNPALPLSVQISNYSPATNDNGKYAYADAVRFIGEQDQRVNSTPVHAKALIRKKSGLVEETNVVLVADENGYIHCLDGNGNPDGTTTEYWTYPSRRDKTGYDPNLGKAGGKGPDYGGANNVAAEDRVPTAEMPQGFDLSSGLVQRINGKDYFFIGSRNGRVYCIDMEGRGDYDATDPNGGYRLTGTTTRVWTYPSTYPSNDAVGSSELQHISGSISYGEPNGRPTIFVPATAGRIYALSATGRNDRSTTVRWTFPLLTDQHLGPIQMTPAVGFNRVYFGTTRNPATTTTGEVPGQFYAINWGNGKLIWQFQGTDDFLSSPAIATGADLEPANATPGKGLIYTIDQNRFVRAHDPDTGVVQWFTNELGSGAEASLTFAWQTVYNNLGTPAPFPVVLVPTQDGHFRALFARTADVNRFGSRLAWSYMTYGETLRASLAVQGIEPPAIDPATNLPVIPTGWMYGADDAGVMYAFSNTQGSLVDGTFPGTEDLVPNNPRGDIFRKAKLKLINRAQYQRLRLPTKLTPPVDTANNTMTYKEAEAIPGSSANLAFEWGETAYILVYNFPWATTNPANQAVDPPIVNVSFSVNGKTIRGIAVQSRQFSLPGEPYNAGAGDGPPTYDEAPDPSGVLPDLGSGNGGDTKLDGYAILAFPFQNSGANSLPPGDGEISISISSASLNSNNVQQNVILNPAVGASRFPFKIANPLAIVVAPTNSALPNTISDSNFSFGLSTDPANIENIGNGTYNTPSKTNASLLGATAGLNGHNSTGKLYFYVVDRSMMSLLRPDGLTQGLDGVRLVRRDLAWEGGAGAVYKGIRQTYNNAAYDGFEDLPTNSPNNSLDYPDIHAERVTATKDPNGNAENPLFSGVTLLPPLDGTTKAALDENSDRTNRIFRGTLFEMDIDVPRFQPANVTQVVQNSAGAYNTQGYIGRVDVFVDSAQNGRLDTAVREAFRSLNISTGVDADERLSVTTPTVDLGTLPAGAGYYPAHVPGVGFDVNNPDADANVFQPWRGNYTGMFKTFGVQNEGNVNLLNVRVAKASNFGTPSRLTIGSAENDGYTWFDSLFDLWSDIDPQFGISPIAGRPVILPKARVQDRIPTSLQSNPIRRENPNLGTTGKVTLGGNVVDDVLNKHNNGSSLTYQHGGKSTPVIGVSVPIGMPVGQYQQRIRVFEDSTVDNVWSGDANSGESSTDPGFLLSFKVKETPLTGSSPLLPMADTLGMNGVYSNANIQPAAARDAFGSLILAYASNRPNQGSVIGTPDTGAYKLFFNTLDSGANFSTGPNGTVSTSAGDSPLRDLNFWQNGTGTSWFRPYAGSNNGYPSTPLASLFGLNAGESFVGSPRYGNPSFPAAGEKNPFANGYFQGMYMGFTGQVQRKNADNTLQNESRLMLSVVKGDASGSLSVGDPVVLPDNPQSIKGKPAIIQAGGNNASTAIILYPVVSAGSSTILYTRYSPSQGFHPSQALPFGTGFTSVSAPSAIGRVFAPGMTYANSVIDLTFQGKLRGRPYPEVFMGRLQARDAANQPSVAPSQLVEKADGTLDTENAFAWLPQESNENIQADSEAGLYRSRGVYWNRNGTIGLVQVLGTTKTNLLIDGTGSYDQQTGLISYSTRLGGKVFMDPQLGTVRFSNAIPARGAQIKLTYTPRFLRVSQGGASGYNDPIGLYDNRLITDSTYWRQANGNQATLQSGSKAGPLTNDRMLFTYNRAAAGSGQAARPFMTSMRFGVRLDYRLPTLTTGEPGFVQGTNTRPAIRSIAFQDGLGGEAFEIDAAQGRVYFPASAEGRMVQISYYGVDAAGNVLLDGAGRPMLLQTDVVPVALIAESGEAPIPIETSVNESNLLSTLDPFTYRNVNPTNGGDVYRRPPLVWLFWTSTRNGSPNLYFESIAPRWSPIPVGH